MKLLVITLGCIVACHHDPQPTVPTARILSAVPDAAAVTALIAARSSRFAGYTPEQLGFDRAHAAVIDSASGPALLQCRWESDSPDQIRAAWDELARAFRAALPAGWEARDEGKRLRIGPPGDSAIIVSWESQGLFHKTYAVELDVWSGAAPGTFDPASADPVADVLAASAHGFARYSPAPLGFPDSDDAVSTRVDDTNVGKALHCERRSGSKSDIKRAFHTLAARFKASVPKDWRVEDQGDVVTFYLPGPNASSVVVIEWVDRKPGLMAKLSSRAASPADHERYLLSLDVFPVKP